MLSASRNRLTIAIGTCAVLVTASPAIVVQLYYDPFNIGAEPSAGQYTVGPIAGQNPSTGSFFTGAWQIRDPGAPHAVIQATGLSYLGSPSSGGSLTSMFDIATGQNNSTPQRTLATPWDANTSTAMLPSGAYYMGFEVNFGTGNYTDGTTNDDMGYRAVEFRHPDGTFAFGIAYNGFNSALGAVNQDPRTGRMVLDNGALQIISNSPNSFVDDNGATHLVVLKFVLSATAAADSVSLFLDPTDATEPVIPGALLNGIDLTLGIVGGALYGANAPTFPVFDELRVGTTFADAVPVFPTPGDTNGDHLVDMTDYLNIFHAMNLTGVAVPNLSTDHPDVNGDGKVTIADYRIWKDHRTDLGAGAGAGLGVPEPTTWILAFTATVALMRCEYGIRLS